MKQDIDFEKLRKYPFIKVVFTNKDMDVSKREDREKICKEIGFHLENLTFNKQVHGSRIRIIKEDNISVAEEGDGLITNLIKVPLLVFVADCVSIGIIDLKKKVIGVAHAGWRGTYEEIGEKLIQKMCEQFYSERKDMVAVIGPSIGPCCYEVGYDVIQKFNNKFTNIKESFYIIREGRYFLNLWKLNEYSLVRNGIKKEEIINLNLCTYCNKNLFHSYRRDEGTGKRMGLILELE